MILTGLNYLQFFTHQNLLFFLEKLREFPGNISLEKSLNRIIFITCYENPKKGIKAKMKIKNIKKSLNDVYCDYLKVLRYIFKSRKSVKAC